MVNAKTFEQLSNNTVSQVLCDGAKRYFSNITSASPLLRKLWQEEAEYQIIVHDVMIKLLNGNMTDAIYMSFGYETDGKTEWFDLLISEIVGLYLSDVYC